MKPHRFSLRNISLHTRLTLWNVCIVALLLVILGGIVQYTVQTVLLASIDHDLWVGARQMEGFAQMNLLSHPPVNPSQKEPPPGHPFNQHGRVRAQAIYWPRILTLQGRMVGPTEDLGAWDMAAFHQAAEGGEHYSTINLNENQLRILSRPVRWKGRVIGVIQSPHPLDEIQRAIDGMKRSLLTLIPVGLLFAGLGGAAVTRRALRPVGQIVKAAERIGTHDLNQRLQVVGNDEFSQLARSFNKMLARLETDFAWQVSLVRQLEDLLEKQRRFTADASHELKTPLSVAKLHCSLLRQAQPDDSGYREAVEDSVEDIEQAIDRMNRLVQDLLLLAQHDAGQPGRCETDLLVCDVLEQARHNAGNPDGKPIQIVIEDPALTLFGNEDEIVRVFSNLFENAVRYTPPTGKVQASARLQEGTVVIRVSDTGAGIPPEHLAHLGERFYRIDAARARLHGGSGLGLSICKSIIEQHKGTITFESVVGEGTTVSVMLPPGSTQGSG